MLAQFTIETIAVDMALAERAAAVRARTNLKLPDAFALATAIHAEHRGLQGVTWPASTTLCSRPTRPAERHHLSVIMRLLSGTIRRASG